jgi:hypothetical protein
MDRGYGRHGRLRIASRCATDGGCLRLGLSGGLLAEPLIGLLPAEAAVGAVVVVVVLPLAQLVVEGVAVVDDDALE